jgi:hypothetical protein
MAALFLSVRVLPGKVQKVKFCPMEEGDSNRSAVSANLFLTKLSNKETYKKKMLLGWA